MTNYEIQKWTRILNHPNSTDAQKVEAREHLDGKDTPEPAAEVAPPATYNAAEDELLEFYLTTPRPPRHERPEGYWPPQDTLAGVVHRHLRGGELLGYYTPEQAVISITILIPVLAFTKSWLIARESAENIHHLLNPRYLVPEPLRTKASAALAKYQEQFSENGQVEAANGR